MLIKKQYLRLFANCILVKGVKMSLIMDIQRENIYRFDSEWLPFFDSISKHDFMGLINNSEEKDKTQLYELKDFILKNELGFLTEDPERFPPINFKWETNEKINNAIIDIKSNSDYLDIALQKFNSIDVKHLQVRFFSIYSTAQIRDILNSINKYDFISCEIILQYSHEMSESETRKYFDLCPALFAITIANSPNKNHIKIGTVETKLTEIFYVTQEIPDESSCGKINLATFNIPDIATYCERLHCNSCLSRKISIDSNGLVKNCPSLVSNYGHINDCNLFDLINNETFKRIGIINKDKIAICKDCEYRYLCIDCRAYTIGDLYSKPLKCNYNPELAIWK